MITQTLIGFATYYTVASSSSLTASGRPFVESELTCALPRVTAKAWNMRFGDTVHVTCLDSGRTVIARYTDTGPGGEPQKRGVVIDLTPAAFGALWAELSKGRIRVMVTPATRRG